MQQPDTTPGDYFVSVVDPRSTGGTGRMGLLSGPYRNHAAALADLEEVKRKAQDVDRWAVFYAFGTVRLKLDSGCVGVLNKHGVHVIGDHDVT